MREYVFQIQSSNYGEGCGFFLGGRFYTCAHVLKECEAPYIRVNSIKVPLDKPVLYRLDENQPDGYDIAVFDIPQVNSPLVFADREPKAGESLDSISWRTIAQGVEFLCGKATVLPEREGNYYAAEVEPLLKKGSSGSPLVGDGKVYGMLCAGQEGSSLCVFLSSESILKLTDANE